MGQVSITSQEQITLPVSIRRRWGIAGAASLDLEFDEENNLVVLRPKPSVDEVLKYLSSLPRNREAGGVKWWKQRVVSGKLLVG